MGLLDDEDDADEEDADDDVDDALPEALAVEVALVDELEDDEPLSVDEAEPDAVFEGVRV